MPEYDEYYVLRQIKESAPECKIIIIALDKSHYTLEKLGKEGADCILYKPFDIPKLVQTITDLRRERLV